METTVSQKAMLSHSFVHRTIVLCCPRNTVQQMIFVMHFLCEFTVTNLVLWCDGYSLTQRQNFTVCEMEPGVGLSVHATIESCQVMRVNDKVVCAQGWSQRARPLHWFCSLLARQRCINCLVLILTFVYSKIHSFSAYVYGSNNKKYLSLETYRILV